MIRYVVCATLASTFLFAQSIADVVEVNKENSSASSLVADRISKMQSVRVLNKGILENIQDPFEYNKVSKQNLPARMLGGSAENGIKVLIGSKIKVGENWLGKGENIGANKILDIKKGSVLLQEEDGNILTQQLKKGKIDGLEIK